MKKSRESKAIYFNDFHRISFFFYFLLFLFISFSDLIYNSSHYNKASFTMRLDLINITIPSLQHQIFTQFIPFRHNHKCFDIYLYFNQ